MKDRSLRFKLLLPGVLLILIGIFTPSAALIAALRPITGDIELANKLILGASLFRLGLIVHGSILLVFSSSRVLKRLGWNTANAEPPQPAQKAMSRETALMLGLLIASVLIRLHRLGEGLWLDEIAMYVRYVELPFGQFITTYDSENQHFLYTILSHFCAMIFSDQAFAIRLPALAFGVASIWALYLLGSALTSRIEALLSATLLSLSYYHVWFSQNARGYSGLLFWAILSSWLFVRATERGSLRFWIGYAAGVALGMFTQFIMIFVVAGHFLIYLHHKLFSARHTSTEDKAGIVAQEQVRNQATAGVASELRWRGFWFGFVLAGLFTIQLYALVLPQFFDQIGMHGTVARWNDPFWTLAELVRGLKISFAGSFAAVIALAIFLAGVWSYAQSRSMLIWLLIIPPVLGSIVVIAMGHPLWPRFFFFAFGFGALIVIRGAMVLGEWFANRFRIPQASRIGLVFCLVIILISATAIPLAYAPKQDFLGAQRFVEKHRSPGDTVVTVGRAAFPYRYYYKTDFREVTSVADLNQLRLNARRTWLLYMIPGDIAYVYPEIMKIIQQEFRIVKKFPSPLSDGPIYVCVDDLPVVANE